MSNNKHRITWDVIRSGQPGPYQDTEHVVRVIFEYVPYDARPEDSDTFKPWYMLESVALEGWLEHVPGFTRETRKDNFEKLGSTEGHFASYLDYVKPIGARPCSEILDGGDPNQMVAYIYEFRVVTPFTD